MSVITSEELDSLRRWVSQQSDEDLKWLNYLGWRVEQESAEAAERQHWFRVRRLVAEEWERRNGSDGG